MQSACLHNLSPFLSLSLCFSAGT
uniref:Uncharacterized protein n=1 Tax=Rhizophora mucronata TaxID=61149 RepID=A0A2P2Q878_RHIMU